MTESTQDQRDKLRAVQSMVREDDWSRSLFKALNDADRLQRAEELLRKAELGLRKTGDETLDEFADQILAFLGGSHDER